MNVIVFASRKGGSGKSTLAAHLAAHVAMQPHRSARHCLLIDADAQGSLTLWHRLRRRDEPPLRDGTRGVAEALAAARREGCDWVFVDTPPNMSTTVSEAIRAATLVVVPARLTLFDLAAVKETIDVARAARTPYALVINAAPPKRGDIESAVVTRARRVLAGLDVPIWAGQITYRASYAIALESGEGVNEYAPQSQAAAEVAQLWTAIERSVKAIRRVYAGAAMRRAAA